MKAPTRRTLIIASIFTVIDQLTKVYALKNFDSPVIVIKDFFSFTLSQNTGVAFSIAIPRILLIILTILLLCLVIYIAIKELNLNKTLTKISIALIIGGGLGNLIDRFTHGYVVDFIAIWKWPTFNLADIFITIGVLLIIAFYGRIKRV